MQLPTGLSLPMMQTRWKSLIDVLLKNLLTQGQLLSGVELASGTTAVNHLLGRKMIGWAIVDQDASANIYRSAPMNDQTLTLTSSATVTVNLWVF
jgi:hypothetical protein